MTQAKDIYRTIVGRLALAALAVTFAAPALAAATGLSLTGASGCCYPGGYNNQTYNYLGSNVPGCNAPAVNGTCNNSTYWSCSSGDYANPNNSDPGAATWDCIGRFGGSTDHCSKLKPGSWVASDPTCDTLCGTGVQTTTHVCQGGNGVCDPATKPADILGTCTKPACVTYTGTWQAASGACTATCGGGTQVVAYRCSTGNEADCDPDLKPANATLACNTQACTATKVWSWTGSSTCFISKTGSGGYTGACDSFVIPWVQAYENAVYGGALSTSVGYIDPGLTNTNTGRFVTTPPRSGPLGFHPAVVPNNMVVPCQGSCTTTGTSCVAPTGISIGAKSFYTVLNYNTFTCTEPVTEPVVDPDSCASLPAKVRASRSDCLL